MVKLYENSRDLNFYLKAVTQIPGKEGGEVILLAPTELVAYGLRACCVELAKWLQQENKNVAIVQYCGIQKLSFPIYSFMASLNQPLPLPKLPPEKNKVFTGPMTWTPAEIDLLHECQESGLPMGLNLLTRGEDPQIWINQAAADMMSLDGFEAINLKRTDYFDMSDLERLQQTIRDTPADGSFEFRYKARFAVGLYKGQTANFVSRYRKIAHRYTLGVAIASPELIPAP